MGVVISSRVTKIQPFGAVPLDAVGEVAGDVHGDAVGVAGVGEEFSVDVPEAGGGELGGAPDFDGTG